MAEPLIVESARLHAAGARLQELQFPDPPPAPAPAGSDAVSVAIGETLPIIEAPVLEGLPKVKAALDRSASNLVAAAQVYSDTDGKLGAYVSGGRTNSAGDENGAGPRSHLSAAPPARDTQLSGDPGDTPKPPSGPQFDEIVAAAAVAEQGMQQGMQYVSQGVQGIAGSVRHGGATPTPLAAKTDHAETAATEHRPVEGPPAAGPGAGTETLGGAAPTGQPAPAAGPASLEL